MGFSQVAAPVAAPVATYSSRLRTTVVLNQVLVAFGSDDTTRQVIRAVQDDGTCWCAGTEWHGRAAMRISVSSWGTMAADVDQSAAAITRVASAISPPGAGRSD